MYICPHKYLQEKGYMNTRGEIDSYIGSAIYKFPSDVAQNVQSVLGLDIVPDFAVVKNGKVIDKSSAIVKSSPDTPLIYSLFFLEYFKERIIASPIMGEKIIHQGEICHKRDLAINIMSSRNDFETIGGIYLSRKKIQTFQAQQVGKL